MRDFLQNFLNMCTFLIIVVAYSGAVFCVFAFLYFVLGPYVMGVVCLIVYLALMYAWYKTWPVEKNFYEDM